MQKAIDGSPWRPSDSIHAVRGKPLMRDGKIITDIDAIGVSDEILLLVSCKSIPYSPEYDSGKFESVLSAVSASLDGSYQCKQLSLRVADPAARLDQNSRFVQAAVVGRSAKPVPKSLRIKIDRKPRRPEGQPGRDHGTDGSS